MMNVILRVKASVKAIEKVKPLKMLVVRVRISPTDSVFVKVIHSLRVSVRMRLRSELKARFGLG